MRRLLAAVLSFIVPATIFAGANAYKVTYDGGSIADIKAGTGLKLYIEVNQVRFVKDSKELVTIPASSVTEISYGKMFTDAWERRLPLVYSRSAWEH